MTSACSESASTVETENSDKRSEVATAKMSRSMRFLALLGRSIPYEETTVSFEVGWEH